MNNVKKYILSVAVVTFIVTACIAGYFYADSTSSSKMMDEIAVVAHGNTENASSVVSKTTQGTVDKAQEQDTKASLDNDETQILEPSVDIISLRSANPDIDAWINVPGTVIDYPIAQHPTDDTYYLSHGPEGLKSSHGCPFIETCDDGTFQEFNTVVYGHNMNDGSMFAGLHKFEDSKFLKEHREITVTTADHVFTYRIFAAVMYSDAYIPYFFDDKIKADRTAFIKSLQTDIVKSRSIVLNDEKVTEADTIITLSTCDKKLRNKRFLVVGVLKKIDGVDVKTK